jgi:hypothetical protein
MTTDNPDTLVRRFIDGDLSDADVRDALHRIADDAEAREQLRFELEMTQELAASRGAGAPPDFAARTMDAVADRAAGGTTDEDETSASLVDRLRRWWTAWTTPRPVRLRPVYAPVAVLLLAAAALWPALSPGPTPSTAPNADPSNPPTAEPTPSTASAPAEQPAGRRADREVRASASPAGSDRAVPAASDGEDVVWTRFVFTSNDAESVAVAGDFSNWEPIPLSPRTVNGQTVWTGLVPVGRGEHEYQFVINGSEWVTDPLAPVKRNDGFGAKNAVLKL